MARSYHSLPDEIVREIIAPRLSVPDDLFRDNSPDVSPFSTPSPHPCANILVVCKQWMRVATPLLYHVIILRSSAQASSLAHALKQNPDFGRYIVKLRLEGGFGSAVEKIIRLAPNVKQLVLCLAIWSHDNVSGLVNSLHLLQPTHLFLVDGAMSNWKIVGWKATRGPGNSLTKKLTSKVCACIKTQWHHLEFCDFPYDDHREPVQSRGQEIATALSCSSSVRVVSVRHGFRTNDLEVLSHNKNLQSILVKPDPAACYNDSWEPQHRWDIQSRAHLCKLLKYERPVSPIKKSSVVILDPNPFFTPLANVSEDIRERIWGRIIMFACTPDQLREIPPSYTLSLALRLDQVLIYVLPLSDNPISLSQMRRRLTQVSKLFYRLAVPYLYRDAGMPKVPHMLSFARTISECPSLASHIHTLAVPASMYIIGESRNKGAEAERVLLQIIKQATNLTEIEQINYWFFLGQHNWDWSIMDSFDAARMIRLGGLVVAAPSSKAAFLSLAKFENLTELELYCGQGSYDSFEDDPLFPANCLHKLERLTCSEKEPEMAPSANYVTWDSFSLLDVILGLELPSLRSFTMKNKLMRSSVSDLQAGQALSGGRSIPITPPDFTQFITKHGRKLVYMEVGSLGTWSPLPHCPNLKTMTMVVGQHPPSPSFFDCGVDTKHQSLEKITFAFLYEGKRFSAVSKWPEFFDKVDFQASPSLELHIPACRWPTNDREIKQGKNVWVERAERLLREYNVRITDEKGVQWVPRLGGRAKKVKKAV